MTLTSRIALLVVAALVSNTALVLLVSRDRARGVFRAQSEASLDAALAGAEAGITDASRRVIHAVEQVLARESAIARLEEAAAGRIDPEQYAVVRAAEDLRAAASAPPGLDILRVLDARGTVLSSSPDVERFGVPDRQLTALATLAGPGIDVGTIPIAAEAVPALLFVRRTAAGLVVAGGRRIDGELASALTRRAGAEVRLRTAGGRWIGPDGAAALPATIDSVRAPARRILAGGTLAAGAISVLDGALELLVVREDPTLADLENRLTRTTLTVGAVVLLLSLGVAVMLARTIARPLRVLTRATLRIAAGDWDHRVRAPGGASEFRSLVTAFNTMQGELARQRDALLRAERASAWQDAARRVAHELKNALTPLQLAWERLTGAGERDPAIAESADAIAREITNLRRLVMEFSELGRWPEPEKHRVDLSEIARKTAELYGPDVSVALAAPGVAEVEADPGQIARAIANLVQNALDALDGTGTVVIRTRRDTGSIVIAVTDDGPGMDEETLANVFTPYFTRKTGGTGLGLSIVERIADANGAACEMTSRPGEGTTVTLRFPHTPPAGEA